VLCQLLKQCAADMKPVSDRLSKTGSALMKLVVEDEAERIREVVDELTSRFEAVKNAMRQRANRLDDALQHMSEVRVITACYWSLSLHGRNTQWFLTVLLVSK